MPLPAIILAIPMTHSRFLAETAEAFVKQLDQKQHQIRLLDTSTYPGGLEHILRETIANPPAALVLALEESPNKTLLDSIASIHASPLPIILLGQPLPALVLDRVNIDIQAIARRLATMLCDRQHNHIALATLTQTPLHTLHAFQQGLRQALTDNHYPATPSQCLTLTRDLDAFDPALLAAMARRERPTAFLCTDAQTAATLDRQLSALGFTSGEHIEIAAIDDDRISQEMGIPMFRLTRPAYAYGAAAARLLLERLNDPTRPPQTITLDPGPVITGLTGATIEPPRRRGGPHH